MQVKKRYLYSIHKILGLVLGLNFLFLCLSGTLLIWKDEIQNEFTLTQPLTTRSFQLVEDYIKSKYPNKKILSVFKDEKGLIQARVGERDQIKFRGAIKLSFNANGELIDKNLSNENENRDNHWLDIILLLHRELLLGNVGKLALALMGLFLILSYILGVKLQLSRRKIKKFQTKKLLISYMHGLIGLRISPWLFLITLSGIFLALNNILITLFISNHINHLSQDKLLEPQLKISQIIKLPEKSKLLNGYELDFLSYPQNQFSTNSDYIALFENHDNEKKILKIKANNINESDEIKLPWYIDFLLISTPIHFGNFGGLFIKVIWSLLGIICSLIPISGFYLSLNKRKKAKKLEISFFAKENLIKLYENFNILFLGLYQACSLGSLHIIAKKSQLDFSLIALIYGLSVLGYYIATRLWQRFLNGAQFHKVELLGFFGVFLSTVSLTLALTGFSPLVLFIISRVVFVLIGSLTLSLTQYHGILINGGAKGQLNQSKLLNQGRACGFLLMLVFGQYLSLSLVCTFGLIYILGYGFRDLNEYEIRTSFRSDVKYSWWFPFGLSALGSFYLIMTIRTINQLMSPEASNNKLIVMTLLLSSMVMVFTKRIILSSTRLSKSKGLLFIGLLTLLISVIYFSIVSSILQLMLFICLFSTSLAILPHYYYENSIKSSRDKDILKITTRINANQIAGNALGVIASSFYMGVSI